MPGSDNRQFADRLPPGIEVDQRFLARGQERYAVFCSPCHGLAGHGDGLVHRRAQQLVAQGKSGMAWQAPKNLLTDRELNLNSTNAEVAKKQEGYLFHVITNGFNNMAGYKSQIPVEDRWAIVAYVAALQRSQGVPQ